MLDQVVKKLTFFHVIECPPDFLGQLAFLLLDSREGVLGDIIILYHPIAQVSEKSEVIVVRPCGNAGVDIDIQHEGRSQVAVERPDVGFRTIAPRVQP